MRLFGSWGGLGLELGGAIRKVAIEKHEYIVDSPAW